MAGFGIDFGALQPANPFGAYAQGRDLGQQHHQQQAQREAGNVFASDPQQAAQILMGAGDFRGGMAVNDYATGQRREAARTAALGKAAGGDLKGAQTDALSAGDVETFTAIAKMDETQRARAKQTAESLAAVGQWVSTLPYEQRKAAIQQQRALLEQQGLTPEQIDSFDPTDEAIQGFTSQALGLKGMLEQAEKARNFGLKEKQFGETVRHNQTTEQTARGQLGVAQGRLGLGREQHRARLAAGGYGTPGVGGAGGLTDNDVEID